MGCFRVFGVAASIAAPPECDQPRTAARYRERKAPSGIKENVVDARALADALRLDGHTWQRPEDPLIQELRLLCRDEVALIEAQLAQSGI
jgi:hypothetical protein